MEEARGAGAGVLWRVYFFWLRFSVKMMPTANALLFDGAGESFLNYAQEAGLWLRVANLGPIHWASALILNMKPVDREVCMGAGDDRIRGPDGATKISRVLQDHFTGRRLALLRFERTAKAMGEYPVRSDLLRRKAELRMQMGGPFPETFGSFSRVQNASLSRSDKSMESASAQGNLEIPAAARQTRRLFGPIGGPVRRDVLAAMEIDANSSNVDIAAMVAYRGAKKSMAKREGAGQKYGQRMARQ